MLVKNDMIAAMAADAVAGVFLNECREYRGSYRGSSPGVRQGSHRRRSVAGMSGAAPPRSVDDVLKQIAWIRSHPARLADPTGRDDELLADEILRLRAELAAIKAPGHTDLMVSPEGIDAFIEKYPPPD